MKIVRKQAIMALLLFSVAAIVPVYGNEEVIVDNQEKVAVEPQEAATWYERNKEVLGEAVIGITSMAVAFYVVSHMFGSPFQKKDEQPTNSISNSRILGSIVQTDGKNTTVMRSWFNKPISVKQDSTGTWFKKNDSDSWVLWN